MKIRHISSYPSNKKLILCATLFVLTTQGVRMNTDQDLDEEAVKKPSISEEDAMYMFSQANLDGVRIMDLPDAP